VKPALCVFEDDGLLEERVRAVEANSLPMR